jgi:hypothetical protein
MKKFENSVKEVKKEGRNERETQLYCSRVTDFIIHSLTSFFSSLNNEHYARVLEHQYYRRYFAIR